MIRVVRVIAILLVFLPVSLHADNWSTYQSATSTRERVEILAAWAARLEGQGTALAVDLLFDVNAMAHGVKLDKLQGYAGELRRIEEEPLPFGEVTYRIVSGQVIVGSTVSVEVTYRTASMLPAGTRLLLARHWQSPSPLIVGDGGNVAITSIDPDAEYAFGYERFSSIHGSPFGIAELPVIELRNGLPAGQSIVLRLNDIELPHRPAQYPLPVYVQFPGETHWNSARFPAIDVAAGSMDKLLLEGPLTVQVNEPFSLVVAGTDEHGNRVPLPSMSLDLLVNGIFDRRLQVGGETTVLPDFVLDDDGIYTLEVRSGGGGLRAELSPIIAKDVMKLDVTFADLRYENDATLYLYPGAAVGGAELRYETRGTTAFGEVPTTRAVVDNLPLAAGGRILQLNSPERTSALPELVSDHRRYSPDMVEVYSGASSHEWLLNHYAAMGYRVSVGTGSTSLVARQLGRGPLTAVVAVPGQRVEDALGQGRTYAVLGQRIFLDYRLNGGRPGDRVAVADERSVSATLISASPIIGVQVVKNGQVVHQSTPESAPNLLRVSTWSDSKPLNPGQDVPRNAREWIGFIRFVNADVVSLDTSALHAKPGTAAMINPRYPDRADFYLWTHGSDASFLVQYEPRREDQEVRLEIALRKGFEDVDFQSEYRAPAETPAIRQTFNLAELESGVQREFRVDGYVDQLRIEPATVGKKEWQVDYVDASAPMPGDYYYIRAQTLDGSRLISSPIYVGGSDHE